MEGDGQIARVARFVAFFVGLVVLGGVAAGTRGKGIRGYEIDHAEGK